VGVRQVNRTVKVGTGWNGTAVTETAATTSEVYDPQGRLYRVLEPANPDGTSSTTTYLYDVGNRLMQVTQTAKTTAGANVTQTRLFGYDNRGFLTSERHPEKGASGNGYVTYGSYDARGHAGTRTDGPHTLRFTYDGAERPTQVEESLGFGLYRPLKSFTFAATNGTGDYRRGKLQVARGYNYPVIGSTQYTVELRETYTYGGKQGRVSQRDTANVVGGSLFESFTQSWTWNDLGDPASVTYPRCTHAACTAATLRTVAPAYTNGFVTAVPGFASSISYHPNGQVNQVTHLNTPTNAATWVSDTYTKDPYNLPRPQKIDAKRGTTLLYQTGLYSYDGAGDVTKMGSSYYLYDRVSRVVSGVQYIGQGGGTGAGGYAFSHTFDGFGNLQAMTTKTGRSTPTSSTTNRLTGSVGYDAAGNLTSWNGNTYQYDALDQMWSFDNGSTEWLYLYTADGERIWAYDYAANTSRWTLRDLDGKVLREYGTAGGWHVERDYVYRDGQLLAAVTPTGTQHFHLDHLGTIRFITNASGQGLAHHAYFPFGEEATSPTQDAERMKFTGHERDLGNLGSPADDLDYMHARFYNPQTGRFTRVDPMNSADPRQPQSWNRYTYARDNPLKFIDPDGREIQVPEALRESVSQGLQGSADFADIFQTLDALPASEVLVTFGPFQAHSPPGSDAIQSQKIFETGTIEVAISLRVGDTGPPRIGHELYHVLELYQARKSLKKRFQSGEQGITRSSAGYESRAATQAERRIRNQMDESRRKQRQQQKEQNAVDGLNSLSAGREFLDYLIYSPY
jgi:RHS repeat-associated protein